MTSSFLPVSTVFYLFLVAYVNLWEGGPVLEDGVNKNRLAKRSLFAIDVVDEIGNPKTTNTQYQAKEHGFKSSMTSLTSS